MSEGFRYAIDKKFIPLCVPFGVRPSKDGVTLTDDGRFVATYGFLRIEAPLSNIAGAVADLKGLIEALDRKMRVP